MYRDLMSPNEIILKFDILKLDMFSTALVNVLKGEGYTVPRLSILYREVMF